MNLTFNNGLQDRSALRVQRTHYKGHENKNAKKLAGFAVPIPYAQEQLSSAGQHLLGALSIFPLGAEANELMALIYLQALDGRAALRSLDAVASQDLPVSFYAEIRAHNFDRPAKCELSRDHLRFIFLASTYDKKGFPAPPKRQAGQDGLGDLVIEPAVPRALNFDDYAFRLSDVKKVETKGIQVSFHLQNEDFTLSPLLVANIAPLDGPAARRFSNDYTRLFVRYLGLEDSKLGNEGLTGGEKFKLGMKLANSAMTIAMNGSSPMAIVSDVMTARKTIIMLQRTMASLSVQFASWERSVVEQQDVLLGNSFKPIPTEPLKLAYAQQWK